ncbi:MAG: hypothetical protein ABII23_07555 [bacterium]
MRKIIAIIITFGMLAGNVFAAFDGNSFRLQGINPQLQGTLVDEYSDWQGNPADILAINGQRFYTLFSNLDGKGDALFANTSASDAFQFGYVGQPLKNVILPNSQLGILFHQDSAITAGNAGGFAGGAGKASNHNVTVTDVGAPPDGSFITAGDTTQTIDMTGERYIEMTQNDLALTYGHGLGDSIDLGLTIDRRNTESEEPINATYNNSTTAVGAVYPVLSESNTQNAKEENSLNDMTVMLGGRVRLSDRWNVGATVGTRTYTEEQKRASNVTMSYDRTTAAGVPATLTATGTDGAILGGATLIGAVDPGANFTTADGTTEIGNGLTWTGGNFGAALTNMASLNNATVDPDAVGKMEVDGTGTMFGIDTYFDLSEDATLFGSLTINNNPLDLTLDAAANNSATTVDSALAGLVNIRSVTETDTYKSTSGDNKNDTKTYVVGIEQDLPGDVKLGYAAIFGTNNTDAKITVTNAYSRVTTHDTGGNGLAAGQTDTVDATGADTRVTLTRTQTIEEQSDIETTTYQFPIGLELQPFKKLKLRLGVTHQVQETVTKTKVKVLSDTGTIQVTETGGAASATTSTTTQNPRDIANYTDATGKVRTTNYFYGAGYQWSENLSFDILNFTGTGAPAATDSILHLGNWRIGATLIFGGEEEL